MTTEADPKWRLDGRRAVVTGATRGIGAAVTRELLALGAQVTLVARSAADVEAQAAALRGAGHTAYGIAADVATGEGREALVRFAAEQMGGLDILVNNVGTNIRKPSLDYTPEETAHLFDTNLFSAWEMCRAVHPLLAQSASASLINIGSVAGSTHVGSGAPYAMTKAAMDQLTRYLAVEWAGQGIRVNAVNPWYTYTPLASRVLDNPEFAARVTARTPSGRIADPEDIAGIVAFLCLPAARHITAQTIAVDGGFLASGL